MLVVRPALLSDIENLFDLIQHAELGLSTLQISKDLLTERIEDSARAFAKQNARPKGQPYVFVMEDTAVGKIVGTSAVYSKVGGFQPFYSYEIKSVVKESKDLDVKKEIQYLDLLTTHSGPSEIGSLFLSREYQGSGHGRLLSLARFVFMADFQERFEQTTIAEMRGVVEKDGRSPLWDALGSHFFQMEFPRADTLTLESKKFIAELMPQHPIYVPLLPKEAQDVLGQVHPNTVPAKILLEKEGFKFNNFVDIFDGGPTLECETSKIRAIANSRVYTVSKIEPVVDGPEMLISNQSLDFRVCIGSFAVAGDSESNATLAEATAEQLGLKLGDSFRAVSKRA